MFDTHKRCFINSELCGPCKFRQEERLYPIKDLNDVIEIGNSFIRENELIESRSKIKLKPESYICSFHRYSLGRLWRSPRYCLHPLHGVVKDSRRKRTKHQTPLKEASVGAYCVIREFFPDYPFPMFGNLCLRHRTDEIRGIRHELICFNKNEKLEDEVFEKM